MTANTVPPNALMDGPRLVAQMRPALVKYFRRRTGSALDAEDLTQDVLYRALSNPNWTSPEQARGYIFRAAVNRLRDRRRRMRVQAVMVPYDEESRESAYQSPPERVLMAQEELIRIDRALEVLNERTRTVLLLIKLEGLKATAVAEMLGISVRAVNKHVQKALAYLAEVSAQEDLP